LEIDENPKIVRRHLSRFEVLDEVKEKMMAKMVYMNH
jgi:hypothetical protein